jgi:metal-responsive CopG/Arc/MetJ family transcriptional regulator
MLSAFGKAGSQVLISLAMPPELLQQIDQAAAASNISRAAFIKHALSRAVA